jgi:hypothetical protein
MPYSIKLKMRSTLLWTEEEKTTKLQHLFKNRGLIKAAAFYTPSTTASELEVMLESLKKHLKIRTKKIAVIFSDKIKESGHCEITKSKATIIINARHAGNPYICGAVLAHNLCHYLLIKKHLIIFDDPSENEKAADLATVYGGLGLLILNGMWPAGWKAILRKFMSRRIPVAYHKRSGSIYFSPKAYGKLVSEFLISERISPFEAAHTVAPWSRDLLDDRLYYSGPLTSKFMQHTSRLHKRSIHGFLASVITTTLLIGLAVYVLIGRPAFLSEELRIQKQKISQLHASYQGCSARVERASERFNENDSQVQRFIDNERTLCRSLRNRYNHEVNIYNGMLERYKN